MNLYRLFQFQGILHQFCLSLIRGICGKIRNKKKPARGYVQTLERAQAMLLAMCDDRGWTAVIGIEPDKPEDIY